MDWINVVIELNKTPHNLLKQSVPSSDTPAIRLKCFSTCQKEMRLTLRMLFHLSFYGIDFLSLKIKKLCDWATRRQHDLIPNTFVKEKKKKVQNNFAKLKEQVKIKIPFFVNLFFFFYYWTPIRIALIFWKSIHLFTHTLCF